MLTQWLDRYGAKSLTLIPHVPATVMSLEQKFGVRWGAYRMFISTSGNVSYGISIVTINGTALNSSSQ